MNGKLVPILIGALLTISIVAFGYLSNTITAQTVAIAKQTKQYQELEKSVIRIEENMWTKDNQTKFMETKFYPLKGRVDGIPK